MQKKIKLILLMGVAMALIPTVFVEAYSTLVLGLNPVLNFVAFGLLLLALAGCLLGIWWLDKRKEGFKASELFLSGSLCWLLIGVYYHQLFGRCGLVVILFLSFAGVYRLYPQLARRPLVGPLGVIHFWISYVCMLVLFHPIKEVAHGSQMYVDYTYDAPQRNEMLYWAMMAGMVAQGIFFVNLIYSSLRKRV